MISRAVQRRLEEILEAAAKKEVVWPPITEGLLVHLESLFPSRCLGPHETVEDHLRYAGAAELVADLRYHFTQQQGPEGEAVEGEDAVEIALRGELE